MSIPFQKGFLRLEQGSMGDTTFIKINGEYRAREKGLYASKHKWKYDPSFSNRREIAAHFTKGIKGSKLIRQSLMKLIRRKGIDISSRLRKEVIKIVYKDNKSEPGDLKLRAENLHHLTGYNFNKACSLRSVFNTRYSTSADRATGEILITIPSFIPSERIKAPKGSTHYKIVSAGYVYNFDEESYNGKVFQSNPLTWDDVATEDLRISIKVPENSTEPIFIYFGLEFIQQALGNSYPVSLRKLDPLCIVDVIKV